jgi:hypothetical protein
VRAIGFFLRTYRICKATRAMQVAENRKAYLETAQLLVRLRAMADGLGEKHRVGGEIVAAASMSELLVDCEPRLVVFNQKDANQAAWAVHAERLRRAGITMTVMDEGESFAL